MGFALHSNLVIFKYERIPSIRFYAITFTFQSGYIQIISHNVSCEKLTPLHSNLVIFKFIFKIFIADSNNLYIPIWLYSNPSPIIPSIQDILNPVFCLPRYSQVQNYYGGCILLLLNIHLPLFYNICRTLYIL